MDISHAMRVLVQVVDSGSFVRAADALGMSNAAVTRQIASLESHLGARLLHRTTRRLSLTDAGAEFCARSRVILEEIAEAEAVAGEGSAQPFGLLRISAPLSFGLMQLARFLPGFRARHPQLRLDIDLSDRVVDLANEGVDVALRIASKLDDNLVARRIAPVSMVVCASPDYLKRRGTPKVPAELVDHATLSFSYLWAGDEWPFTDANGDLTRVKVSPAVHATNGDLLRELAVAGGGIIMQPTFIVASELERGTLVPILAEYQTLELSLFAVYLSRRHLSNKVRVFIDELVSAIGEDAPRGHPKPRASAKRPSASLRRV
ncbi:LysR family transcriptional regulator [Thiomonas sp. FB-Cd]|uniref:LysR family transcriptional regulator n=1 Tax=Thiomonas sp. FB-Cd TaxID=1158292 RepID=UPI0009E024F1|nr:LysR family transcriptional regulator [Thiomonas sp. FB-Cd]